MIASGFDRPTIRLGEVAFWAVTWRGTQLHRLLGHGRVVPDRRINNTDIEAGLN